MCRALVLCCRTSRWRWKCLVWISESRTHTRKALHFLPRSIFISNICSTVRDRRVCVCWACGAACIFSARIMNIHTVRRVGAQTQDCTSNTLYCFADRRRFIFGPYFSRHIDFICARGHRCDMGTRGYAIHTRIDGPKSSVCCVVHTLFFNKASISINGLQTARPRAKSYIKLHLSINIVGEECNWVCFHKTE